MLRATFQRLVRGVDAEKESKLWRRGILSWDDLEKNCSPQRELFGRTVGAFGHASFSMLRNALQGEDVEHFAQMLDRREHFRIPLTFPNHTLFLDIETTGLSRYYDYITLVGWCYQGQYSAFIRGDDEGYLRQVLRQAKIVVTYNGSLFDIPFLRDKFPEIALPRVHVDLRFLAKRVGLTGGQKAIEKELGFKRPLDVKEIKGEAAPLLWHRYRRGNLDALKLLVEYNHCDIEGMKFIFDYVVKHLLEARNVPASIRKQLHHFATPAKISWVNGKAKARGNVKGIRLQAYSGPTGPAITLGELSRAANDQPVRVVGIDITGSESRPSGWCLLAGSEAVTRMISTDEDLVKSTLAAGPEVVSIDSPLSLPKGRTSVWDDDPGRDEYGIMRICERILKKRGINVYPALIQSMQRLTERGIGLASRFRKLGLPVVESYPGAAQDIMGIPRKRASLDMLREGLAEFGVRGPYLTDQVTHDELDAITAAVVGVFFWGGRFESLGSEEEEALIIPDLRTSPVSWLSRKVIGLSGPIAAGKTTAARYLESIGFHYARYSQVLASLLETEGKSVNRSELQKHGIYVHENLGQRWLGRKLLASLPREGNIVIDGLRFPDDHAFLAETFGPGFRHLYLDAPVELRKHRFETRENLDETFSHAQAHAVEQKGELLRELAHEVVFNESSLEVLTYCLAALAQLEKIET